MLAYYWSLFGQLRGVLWNEADRYQKLAGFVGLLVIGLAACNPEVGSAVTSGWEGVPRWWALVLVGVFVLVGLARANYEHVRTLERTVAELSPVYPPRPADFAGVSFRVTRVASVEPSRAISYRGIPGGNHVVIDTGAPQAGTLDAELRLPHGPQGTTVYANLRDLLEAGSLGSLTIDGETPHQAILTGLRRNGVALGNHSRVSGTWMLVS